MITMETEIKTNSKRIFKYHNGIEEIYEDPFEIDWRYQDAIKMMPNIDQVDQWMELPRDDEGNILDDIEQSKIKMYNDACHIYIPIITKVFQLKPLDKKTGEGMTGEEILNIYSDYLTWKFDLKKNTG